MKFKYKTVFIKRNYETFGDNPKRMIDVLDSLGAQGWELVSTTTTFDTYQEIDLDNRGHLVYYPFYILFFKKME